MKSITKELFIMALLLMIVVFMIGMVFYKYIPNNKTIPEPVTYSADTSTKAVLQEITASDSSKDSDSETEVEDVIKSYHIDSKELTTAASKKTYVSGKTDPFAPYSEQNANVAPGTNVVNPNPAPNQIPGTGSNASTGTFFEKKGSK